MHEDGMGPNKNHAMHINDCENCTKKCLRWVDSFNACYYVGRMVFNVFEISHACQGSIYLIKYFQPLMLIEAAVI